ncbi:SprT family zinc-dependent metalloprotease [Guyparkeria sp. 1SP6A2]|nr:SprT family zinc-dependent metalloprotease [Guyparkeria sp. 1SP6A2]
MTRLTVDDLTFEVRRSNRRKTLEIIVDRGGELVLAAPTHVEESELVEFVQGKRFWIHKKLTEKAALQRPIPRKEFVNGEGFLYLGRSYRLKLVDEQDAPLKLINGRFCLRQNAVDQGREIFIRWYCQRGKDWLTTKVREHSGRMDVNPAGVTVQDLGYRWGSCGKGEQVYFHWKTMMLPREIAEYVVVHELVHLHHPHHTPGFWRRLERAMPDYERRKGWLASHGMDAEGL